MAPLRVPCCASYTPPAPTAGDDTVTFKVGRGSEYKEFEVDTSYVLACPGRFADRLQQNRPVPKKEIELPNEEPAVFSLFVQFMETGTLLLHNSDHDDHMNDGGEKTISHNDYDYDYDNGRKEETKKDTQGDMSDDEINDIPISDGDDDGTQSASIHKLIPLFTFANAHNILPLRNTVLSTILTNIAAARPSLPYTLIAPAYTSTSPPSSLRDLLTCTILALGSASEIHTHLAILPKEFLADCLAVAAEVGGVPFQERGRLGRMGWLQDKAERVCREYHLHDGDEEAGGDDRGRDEGGSVSRGGRNRRGRRRRTRGGRGGRGGGGGTAEREAERRREDDEWSFSEEEEDDSDDEGVKEMKRLFEKESEERIQYLLQPLPPRERY